MKTCLGLIAPLLFAVATTARADTRAHEHGAVKLDIAVEAGEVTISVEMPLDNLVGFERAPRNDTERKAAAAALARMRNGGELFRANPEAQCAAPSSKVEAPVLEQAGGSKAAGEHADLAATYVMKCAQPAQLATLDVLVFDAFKRVRRIEVQVAGPQFQGKTVLRPGARQVRLRK